MPNYIALLRGINVSGQKRLLMKDLRLFFEEMGYKDVVTYIQSGNLIFNAPEGPTHIFEEQISRGIKSRFGYEVPVIVRTRDQILEILKNNPYMDKELLEANKVYYVLLKQMPDKTLLAAFKKASYENEVCTVIGSCGYLVCYKGAGNAKLNNNLVEKKLNITATTRNHRTIMKLLELSA